MTQTQQDDILKSVMMHTIRSLTYKLQVLLRPTASFLTGAGQQLPLKRQAVYIESTLQSTIIHGPNSRGCLLHKNSMCGPCTVQYNLSVQISGC